MAHIDSNNVLLYNDVITTLTIVLTCVSIAVNFHLSSTMCWFALKTNRM